MGEVVARSLDNENGAHDPAEVFQLVQSLYPPGDDFSGNLNHHLTAYSVKERLLFIPREYHQPSQSWPITVAHFFSNP
jgi:hypothetical protein